MQSHWIANAHNPNLILFFNGWGMDQRIVSHLRIEADCDVLMMYDYGDLTLADATTRAICAYRQVDVLAWSMGVWAYAMLQPQLAAARIRAAIALNGTPRPIDDVFGIPVAMYAATAQQFSAANRQKFFQRMCGDAETLRWFAPRQPLRALDEQRHELLAIQRAVSSNSAESTPFTCALISCRDKIMPTQHQLRYWQGTVAYTVIDAPHCAFRRWNSWKEIFDHATLD